MQSIWGRYLNGALAGLLATVPMTALMLAGKQRLSWRSQDPLPPRQITRQALRAANAHDNLSRNQETALTAINHFAYGAAVGSVYARLCSPTTAAEAAATGAAYGLAVWSGSYLGLLPALDLYRSATEDTSERNALMIAAHLVWGSSLGLVAFALSTPEPRVEVPLRSSIDSEPNGRQASAQVV
jgi:uncharacterized membrane protein YagU involved in acid resistance